MNEQQLPPLPEPTGDYVVPFYTADQMQAYARAALAAQGATDATDAQRWRTFISLPYAIRAEWAANLSLAPVLTSWVDSAAKEQKE